MHLVSVLEQQVQAGIMEMLKLEKVRRGVHGK
jgi:hypothetical protein